MSQRNRIMEEIEKIEIPEELRERSIMGVRQAKCELRQMGGIMKIAKVAGITAAGLVLAVALGATASPTFAEVVKSWFSLNKTDEGLKKAADEGFAEPINKQVTDQGITLKVKEAIHDVLRISILYGIEQDGKSMDSDRLFDTFIPNGPEDDPYVNRYEIVDGNGNVLPLHLQQTIAGKDRILTLSLNDLTSGQVLQSMSELPDRITVRFDINQIGNTRGKWHLDVPIDLTKAKISTTIVPLNKRYVSPMGFSVDFIQLLHGTSKTELVLQVDETQAWRRGKMSAPMLRYELRDGEGNVFAAFDGLNRIDLTPGNINFIEGYWSGEGNMGHMQYGHPFLPFQDKKDPTLHVTTVYWQERMVKEEILLHPVQLANEVFRKEVNGNIVTFKARLKTEEEPEHMKGEQQIFQGKGWILEVDQQFGTATLELQWIVKEEGLGKGMRVETATELEQDAQGNYRNRTMFFFPDQLSLPDNLTLSADTATKKAVVDWSIPLMPSTEPLPPVDNVPVYEMTVEDLKSDIVKRAEQMMHELVPDKPSELYGVTDYGDRWFLYAKDNSGSIVIVLKETAEPIIVQRVIPYADLDAKLRRTVEETLKRLEPNQPVVFEDAIRDKSKENNRWLFRNERAEITIDALTGKVDEALIRYKRGHFNMKAKAAAEQAYRDFTQGGTLGFTEMKQSITQTAHAWQFYRDGSLYAEVGVRSNRVWLMQLSYKDDHLGDERAAQKKYETLLYTPKQAIGKVDSTVKQVFGIDMEGYESHVKSNEYTFTKQGSKTIKGTVNAKGEFWKFELIPIKGIRD